MGKKKSQLIVALDVATLREAKKLIDTLRDDVEIFKVGIQLFTVGGPEIVQYLLKAGKKVFLDLKYHDIPNTVANAITASIGLKHQKKTIFMCTLHIQGGKEMLERAVTEASKASQAAGVQKPLLLGITVLTSEAKDDSTNKIVLERALLAKEAGLDGVVASGQETAMIRRHLGDDFIIVTPGIRPSGAESGDQKRMITPSEAQANGSDFLVVGRPVIKAEDPLQAVKGILKELAL
jgi:orotidine-5'-phosphate decarboxylase